MSEVTAEPAVLIPTDIARLRQVGSPRLSPDASAVAFTVTDIDLDPNRYSRRIWLAATSEDSTGAQPFTGPGSEVLPRWSPDGGRLAFVATGDDGRSEICVLPVAGGG
jgi:dipeptidyl aminopeptidase/acylaminoacyl peptidase